MNPTSFTKRWIQGIKDLTPAQQLHAKMVMFGGGAVGLSIAFIQLLMRGSWGFAIFIFFMVGLQIVSFIGTRQQYKTTLKVMGSIKAETYDVESAKLNKELGNI